MWIDDLDGQSWTSLWSAYVVCGGTCHALRKLDASCPVCGSGSPHNYAADTANAIGVRADGARYIYMGAEGRYEDYIFLQMLER